MAQDKKVFIGGMDKDSDPRLIKDGDYRDALNIRNISSVDSTSGSVENIEGNTLVPFRFIDETDEIIEFSSSNDGHIVIEEIPVEQVFRSQTILFSGKEDANNSYHLEISYLSVDESSDGSLTASGNLPVVGTNGSSGISWQGNASGTATSAAFLQNFAEGGPLHEITVQDYITGNSLLLKVDSITSQGQDIILSNQMQSNPFEVTYIASLPNTNFLLNFTSNNSQVSGESWSQTVNTNFSNGSLWVSSDSGGANNSITVGSIFDFGVLDDIYNNPNYNIDANNEDVTYSSGLNEGTSGATIDLIISGEEPSSNDTSVVNNVNIFGYNQISGDGNSVDDYDITEVVNMADNIDNFAENGAFEFGDQEQVSSFILDAVKVPSQGGNLGPVPVKGGAGIVTNFAGVSTNFTSNTKLKGFNSSENRSADDLTYNLLEYYYDNTEVVEQSGFSIDKGTLTFAGDSILAGELYLLKSPIIADVSYKLSGTVAGLTSDQFFTFHIFNNETLGSFSDGAFSSFITSSANSVYVGIKFGINFSATESVTITNLRLLLEKTEVSDLRVRFQTSTSLDFNLAFATSEEDLREKLARGEAVDQVTEWFPGLGMSLVKLNSGNDEVDVINSFEYTDLQDELIATTSALNSAQSLLASQESTHVNDLAVLNLQLATDSAAAAAAAASALSAVTTLQEENASLSNSISNLEDIIIQVNNPDIDTDILNLISAYETDKENVSDSLNNIVSSLADIDNSLVANELLEDEINRLETLLSDNEAEISFLNQEITDKNNQVTTLTNLNTTLTSNATIAELELANLNDQILKLDAEAETAVEDYVLLQESFNYLTNNFNNIATAHTELSILYEESLDAFTQEDVDAASNAAIDAIDVINVINEYQDLNDTPKLTELILENNFEGNVTRWDGDNWNFFNGFAVADSKIYGNPGVLRQVFTTPLPVNNYILSLDVLNIDNCSLEISFINTQKDSTFIDSYEVNKNGLSNFSVSIPQVCSGISISLISRSGGSVSLNSVSLVTVENDGKVTPELIASLSDRVDQVTESNQNIQEVIVSEREKIIDLEEDLVLVKKQITDYALVLNKSTNSVSNLSNVVAEVLADLSVSVNLTSGDVTNFVNNFNENQNNVQDQITNQTNLVNNLIGLLNTVDGGTIPSPESSLNEKWLFTFSGGVPVKNAAQFALPTVSLFIRNENISDLGYTSDGEEFYTWSLSNLGSLMTVAKSASELSMLRDASFDSNSFFSKNHPEANQISSLNNLTSKVDFNVNLINRSSGEFYDGSSNSFYYNFYSNATNKNYNVKITALNVQPKKSLVDTDGNAYQNSSTGDKIIGDRGEQRPLGMSTTYLDSQDVSDGLQYEVEFLNKEVGFEFYLGFNSGSILPLGSQSENQVLSDQSTDYNWNVNNTSDPNYVASGGINLKVYSEKIQEATSQESSQSTSLNNSAENFVNSLASPSYSGNNVVSGNYLYPAGNADIIKNKSQNIEEELSGNLLGAKRFVKNKI